MNMLKKLLPLAEKAEKPESPPETASEDSRQTESPESAMSSDNAASGSNEDSGEKLFTLKKLTMVATWGWDVECDKCAICRLQLLETCLRCQAEAKNEECVVVWGECNHCFHKCCMSLWVNDNNRCPLCQQEWVVQRIGK